MQCTDAIHKLIVTRRHWSFSHLHGNSTSIIPHMLSGGTFRISTCVLISKTYYECTARIPANQKCFAGACHLAVSGRSHRGIPRIHGGSRTLHGLVLKYLYILICNRVFLCKSIVNNSDSLRGHQKNLFGVKTG